MMMMMMMKSEMKKKMMITVEITEKSQILRTTTGHKAEGRKFCKAEMTRGDQVQQPTAPDLFHCDFL